MIDFENDPFNVALREYRKRCKQYVEEVGFKTYRANIDADVAHARLGLLFIEWNPKWHELETFYDGRPAHREQGNYIAQASEGLVWEGLRLLRQHYVLDELASI